MRIIIQAIAHGFKLANIVQGSNCRRSIFANYSTPRAIDFKEGVYDTDMDT